MQISPFANNIGQCGPVNVVPKFSMSHALQTFQLPRSSISQTFTVQSPKFTTVIPVVLAKVDGH